MNIFILHPNIRKNVQMYPDKHVVKMILESAQMLCTVLHGYDIDVPYKPTHKNHPCTKWVSLSSSNFSYLFHLMQALNAEWQYRYFHKHNHLSYEKCRKLYRHKDALPNLGMTTFAQAMPDKYKTDSALDMDIAHAYRKYFLGEKRDLFQWTRRQQPYWIKEN